MFSEALKVTREQCFSEQNGDRRDKQNLAVILTDGLPFPEFRRQPAIGTWSLYECNNLKKMYRIKSPYGIRQKVQNSLPL